jgi:hypothetical protein
VGRSETVGQQPRSEHSPTLGPGLPSRSGPGHLSHPLPDHRGELPRLPQWLATYFFLPPVCLIVSTTCVLGLLLAVFTDVKRPLPALRPIFATFLTSPHPEESHGCDLPRDQG